MHIAINYIIPILAKCFTSWENILKCFKFAYLVCWENFLNWATTKNHSIFYISLLMGLLLKWINLSYVMHNPENVYWRDITFARNIIVDDRSGAIIFLNIILRWNKIFLDLHKISALNSLEQKRKIKNIQVLLFKISQVVVFVLHYCIIVCIKKTF